jgi:hypothetical protein
MNTDTTNAVGRAPQHPTLDLWTRRIATMAVAGVAAYASYQRQRDFALAGGADLITARLWPFSVDGLLVLSTAGLLRDARRTDKRARLFLWAAFAAGIVVSLAANIATAPSMNWAPILVAGWPPVALLLAVELLGHRRRHDNPDDEREPERDKESRTETAAESKAEIKSARDRRGGREGDHSRRVSAVSPHRRRGDVGALPAHRGRRVARADRRGTRRNRAHQQLRPGHSAEVAPQQSHRAAVDVDRAVTAVRYSRRGSYTDAVCWEV